jgi:hypothetical protein
MAHGPCESPGAPWYWMQFAQACPCTKVGETAASTCDASVVYFSATAAGSEGLSWGRGPAAATAGSVADATGGDGSEAGAGAGAGAAAAGGESPPPQALAAAPAAPIIIACNTALRDTLSGLIAISSKI